MVSLSIAPMKHLKSRAQDLRRIFEDNITIEYIAEPLKAVSETASLSETLALMSLWDFDVVAVEGAQGISGYIERSAILSAQGLCRDHLQPFHPSELVAISTPLLKLLPILRHRPRLFVLDCNQVSGILTCGDLQKAPVRMLLFGMVTLLEMNLLRLIRRYYPQDAWQPILKPDRVTAARRLWQGRQAHNDATDLLDYLQFCDKRDLLLHHTVLVERLGLTSKRGAERLLKGAERLRNNLAHAQDLVNGSSWAELLDLVSEIEDLLQRCEDVE